ncbi:hypothetical protein HETIRDRAFT_377477, partial [Heterobasidion irregulare TC 32-1]
MSPDHAEHNAAAPEGTPVPATPPTRALSTSDPSGSLPLSPNKGKGVLASVDDTATYVDGGPDVAPSSPDLETSSFERVSDSSSPLIHSISCLSESRPMHDTVSDASDNDSQIRYDDLEPAITLVGKGKGKDLPPTLPPLSFSPTEFYYDDSFSSPTLTSADAGPSSFGSVYTAVTGHDPTPAGVVLDDPSLSRAESIPVHIRIPSRCHSISDLSTHTTHSLPTQSMSQHKFRVGASKSPTALARKLFAKGGDQSDSPSSPGSPITVEGVIDLDLDSATCGAGSCFGPWKLDSKSRAKDTSASFGKGRSYSNPFPLSTAFEPIPPITTPVYTPAPIVLPRKHFDELLPHELQLHILVCLVDLHEEEQGRRERDGKWTVLKASSSKNKWVGREQGVRELVRLSRVCKSWTALVFDGQLWTRLDLRSFPKMPASQILHIAASAGPFIRKLDLAGHTNLHHSTLLSLTDRLSIHPSVPGTVSPCTLLTSINLSGCFALTTGSLHYLLERCPNLTSLSMKGLDAVTNETCERIYRHCPKLDILNMNRCRNLSGAGVYTMASLALKHRAPLCLKEMRLSGLKGITDSVLDALGKATPYLVVLDLSYCRDLHNSSVEAFVSCSDDFGQTETVLLTAREAGHTDHRRYRRRVTRLRHLSFSSCIMLTDIACAHLAHALPHLELLELGGIGQHLTDEGLILLLQTLPDLRKLDLEDAREITDAVLQAITPRPVSQDPGRGRQSAASDPGHALEHLSVSGAANLTNEALSTLIQRCPQLRVLEADGTRVSGAVVKEFTAVVRRREEQDAVIVAIDCRSVGEDVVKELAVSTRPRLGRRTYESRKLGYLDGRDEEALGVGQDECDPRRVVLKTYYSWQTVDAVTAARQKRKRGRRDGGGSGGGSAVEELQLGRARWWSPGGRRLSGMSSPSLMDANNE